MKGLKALRQRLHDLKVEGRQKLEALKKLQELDDLSDSQAAESTALEARISELESDVEKAQADVEKAERELDRQRLFQGLDVPESARIESMDSDPAQTYGFKNFAEFAMAVKSANPNGGNSYIDERLQKFAAPTNYHQEAGSTSGEGFMVPPAMRSQIWDVVTEDDSALLNAVDSEPTSSNSVELLRDETTPWGASGIQAYWAAEGAQFTPSKLVTKSGQVKLEKVHIMAISTDELLEDAPRLNDRLTRKAGLAIRWKASDAIMWGDGVGKPLGYMNSSAYVSVAKESGQSADTVVAANVAKMYSRMLPGSLSRAVWYVNSDVLPQLLQMTLGDNAVYALPSVGFTQAPGGFLFGRPVIPTEHSKTVGDLGDIQFVDPMGYYLAIKQSGIQFATSMHLYFDYGQQAFRWTFRMGGQPYLNSPVSPANGSSTKSHFVALAERA